MITIRYNREEYEYNTYALVTSFYPGVKTVQMLSEETTETVADSITITSEPEKARGIITIVRGETFPEDAVYEYRAQEGEDYKLGWKRFLYDALSRYTGRELPWGALCGVRPTKLILSVLKELGDDGTQHDKTEKQLYEHYRVGAEKARLGIRIAELEDRILKPFCYEEGKEEGISIYIGIPFCPSTCLYCSFLSYPIGSWHKQVAEYLNCLRLEMEAAAELIKGKRLDTVYIGGGTPTALSAEKLSVLLDSVTELLPMEKVREFTVEAGRPDSIDREKLRCLKRFGVSRISVNPQTFKADTLKLIGRHHSIEDVYRAYAEAREEGFDNINMDLILGLPGETLSDVEHTFSEVERLRPDSVTVHSLALKRASRMKAWVEEHGAICGLDHEKAMEMAQEMAEGLNMKPYYLYRQKNMAGNLENTGFAADGKYGLYNILIMEEVQSILAIGAGTVSKRVFTDGSGRIERCDTHKDLKLYLSDIQAMIERKRKLFE